MNPHIFKAYDVRGIYPTELDEQIFHQIGRAFVAYLKAKRIGVGRDMRLSSPTLAAAFIAGAREQGADVVDYGMIATDMIYYAVGDRRARRRRADYRLAQPEAVQRLQDGRPRQLPAQRRRRHLRHPGHDREQQHSAAGHRPGSAHAAIDPRRLREARPQLHRSVDHQAVQRRARRGMRHGRARRAGALQGAPLQDGHAVFHHRWHLPHARSQPADRGKPPRHRGAGCRRQRAEIGIAWDGDADRCFFIDEDGEFIPGDFVTALLAEAFLLKEPGATVVYDLRASYAVKDVAAKYGGKAVMNRVGHAFFKGRMRELNAVFGGEVTGHYYFRDNFYCDNGFIPALLILELMSKKHQSLKQLLEPLRAKYFISGEINTKMPSMDAMTATHDRHRSALQGRRDLQARRDLRRISRLALQRAAVEHRAAAAAEPGRHDARKQMERSGTRCCRLSGASQNATRYASTDRSEGLCGTPVHAVLRGNPWLQAYRPSCRAINNRAAERRRAERG